MKQISLILLLASCDRVFNITTLDDLDDLVDASGVARDAVASDADARDAVVDVGPDATTGCDVVTQTGCGAGDACYPQSGPDICAAPGDKLDGDTCTGNPECAAGYFCAEVAGPGTGICYRICDCGTAPGSTCNQPTACDSTPTHQCRQYTTSFGYCEL